MITVTKELILARGGELVAAADISTRAAEGAAAAAAANTMKALANILTD